MALRFAVSGDLRFISHHDTIRLFERALARSRTPVRYSEGFNPRPRMTIALPRNVGIASSDELLLLELNSPADPSELASCLSREMPPGLSIVSIEIVADGDRRLPTRAEYALDVSSLDRDLLDRHASTLLSRESIDIERTAPDRPPRKIDIRPFILAIEVATDDLRWTQRITPEGTVRPDEMLEVLGLPPREHLHRLRRVAVKYDP